MTDEPLAGVVEIIETGATTEDTPGGSVIVPREVRLNGQRLLCPRDHPVVVHDVEVNAGEAVMVTLTLFARRVIYAAEGDVAETLVPPPQ